MNDRTTNSAPAGSAGADSPAELTFEPDREEQLESMATVGRGPRRLAAAAALSARNRREARQQSRRTHRGKPVAKPAVAPAPAPAPASAVRKEPVIPPPAVAAALVVAIANKATVKAGPAPVRPKPAAKAKAAPAKAKAKAVRAPAKAARKPKGAAARELTPQRLKRARRSHQARMLRQSLDPVQKVADDEAWERWASSPPPFEESDSLDTLDERRPPRRGRKAAPAPQPVTKDRSAWRQRASQAIDNLAEREVTMGYRIEHALLPGRVQAWWRRGSSGFKK